MLYMSIRKLSELLISILVLGQTQAALKSKQKKNTQRIIILKEQLSNGSLH